MDVPWASRTGQAAQAERAGRAGRAGRAAEPESQLGQAQSSLLVFPLVSTRPMP